MTTKLSDLLYFMSSEVILHCLDYSNLFLVNKNNLLGLCLFAAVLQLIAAVDDEMAPRMKPNAAGDPSPFSYYYCKSLSQYLRVFSQIIYLRLALFFTAPDLCIPSSHRLLCQVPPADRQSLDCPRINGYE